jgi:hypothetical protein
MMVATLAELAAWNEYAGSEETVDSYNEDLNSGASGLHPASVRAFHAAWRAGCTDGFWRGRN